MSTGSQLSLDGPAVVSERFAAEPQSEIERQTDEAFSELGYAKRAYSRVVLPAPVWFPWIDIGGGGVKVNDGSGVGNDGKGNQTKFTAGLGRLITPDVLVGMMAGYERFKYDVAAVGGSAKYDGETVGGYFVKVFGNTRFDAALGWTNLKYGSAVGADSGSFTGSRWRMTTELTGNYLFNGFLIRPSASAFVVWEHDNAWTDNVGNLTPDSNLSAGRTALGALATRPIIASGGWWIITPYAGVYADWVFKHNPDNNLVPAGPPIAVINDGWAGRVTAGLTGQGRMGTWFAFGGELGGLGAGYKIWMANLRVGVPF